MGFLWRRTQALDGKAEVLPPAPRLLRRIEITFERVWTTRVSPSAQPPPPANKHGPPLVPRKPPGG